MIAAGAEAEIGAAPSAAARLLRLFESDEAYRFRPELGAPDAKGKVLPLVVDNWKGVPDEDLWQRHIDREFCIGVRTRRADGTCWFGALDVDIYPTNLAKLAADIAAANLRAFACRTKSRGGRVFVFAREAVSWEGTMKPALRGLARRLKLELTPRGSTEIVPGNLWMPWCGGRDSLLGCITPMGLQMSFEHFLAEAEGSRFGPDDLAELAATPVGAEMGSPAQIVGSPADAVARLARYAAELASFTDGRKTALARMAFDMGRDVKFSFIDEDTVSRELELAAIAAGLDRTHIHPRLSSNLKAGIEKGKPRTAAANETAIVTRLSDVAPQPIRWLWPGKFALGKLSVIGGHPGLGKSQLSLAMIAAVTTGRPWPSGGGNAPKGDAVLLSAEDDLADTVRPRLDAAGGDAARVHVFEAIGRDDGGRRTFDLSKDIERLEAVLDNAADPRLVVIDPISAYLGKIDAHRNAEVRGALAPLQDLASRLGVAVILITHMTKSGSNEALSRFMGSIGFVGAGRGAWLVVKDADDPARRLFLSAKNNLGPDGAGTGLAYRIEERSAGGDLLAPVVAWEAGTVDITADEALAAAAEKKPPAKERAADFLRRILADGPVETKAVEDAASAEGISARTLRRARDEIGVRSERVGGTHGAWHLVLPGAGVQQALPI